MEQFENKFSGNRTDWKEVLTDFNFLSRFIIVAIFTIVLGLIILNVTLDPNSDAWFNKLHKPDWMPDGITVVLIFTFTALLVTWIWYKLSVMYKSALIDIVIFVMLALQMCWAILLYKYQDITAGRYLICFTIGFAGIVFLGCAWLTRFSDITFYSLLYVLWLVLVVCFTFNMFNLDKEYKLLGLAKEGDGKLYKKKLKLEIVEGLKFTDDGEKIEFNAEEQE